MKILDLKPQFSKLRNTEENLSRNEDGIESMVIPPWMFLILSEDGTERLSNPIRKLRENPYKWSGSSERQNIRTWRQNRETEPHMQRICNKNKHRQGAWWNTWDNKRPNLWMIGIKEGEGSPALIWSLTG